MSCAKVYDKLWNNYLTKYGDFRERLQLIRNDRHCYTHLLLPRLKHRSTNSRDQSLKSSKGNGKFHDKCTSLLPEECCHEENLPLILSQTDRDQLEKLIQAKDFPNNIFPNDARSRPSIDNELEIYDARDHNHRSSSLVSQNKVKQSITHRSQRSFIPSLSNKSMHKSDIGTTQQVASSSHDPNTTRIINPYKELIERLHKADTTKFDNSTSKIDATIHTQLEKFLSFLHSLDDNTSSERDSNPIDQNTLISLFAVDNHLSSSIYVPTDIHQLHSIPKTILHSLKNTPKNEHILNKIQAEMSLNKVKHSQPFVDTNKPTLNSNHHSHSSNEDNQLNSRLVSTYAVQAFKEFLIHRNKSTRLPKLFHDIDQWHQN